MFIGRKQELDFLNERYLSEKAEFITIYGRRRVGKTELITEFLNEQTEEEQQTFVRLLNRLHKKINS